MHEPGSNRARYVETKARVNKETPYGDFEKVGHVDLKLGHGDLLIVLVPNGQKRRKTLENRC
jgi:hypothetical protein